MRIAVTDANIFIDIIFLEMDGLLPEVGLVIHTTWQVMDELDEGQMLRLQVLVDMKCLEVHLFSGSVLDDFSKYFIHRGLSLADHSVLFISEKLGAMVMSGDGLVRKICMQRNLEVHGILWLLGRCVERELLTPHQAKEKLTALVAFNPRLPGNECDAMLKFWSGI